MSLRGDIRGTGGSFYLLDGIPAIPALIGLFAASQLFDLLDSRYIVEDKEKRTISLGRILWGVWQNFHHLGILIRGSIIGIVIGALPGVGAAVACLISYAETKRTAKDPESFGTGDPRGIVAAESADSSAEGGSMAPLLALGIPGGSGTAILMGAFAMHNITGGPRFIAERLDLVYAIIISNFAQASLLLVMGIGFIYACSAVVKVPVRVLMPTVMATAVLGSYTITENMVGPVTVLVCAVIGWALRRYDYPVANVVIGLLLARMVEGESLRTWQLSGGQFFDFLSTRPTAMVLAALLVASLVWPVIRQRLRKA
jgi:putative tricarboxylic transport membrane protein